MPNNYFLIDTSAWIFALRKAFIPEIKDRIGHLLKQDKIVTTDMIKLELLGGVRTEKEFRRLKLRLDALDLVETTVHVWENACSLAFYLRRKGITVPYTDILIAACAIDAHATIIHTDIHFDIMAGSIGLKVESFVQTTKNQ